MDFGRHDAIPRLGWGKYVRENGRMTMPFSLTVRRAFCGGIHVGRYLETLQSMPDAL